MEQKALRLPALVLFGIYAVYSIALVPLYQILSADLVLSDTLLWDAVDLALSLFEVLGIGAAIGFLVQGVYRYTFKGCLKLYYLIAGALLFKYVTSIVSVSIVMGTLDLTADFLSMLVSLLIEAGELALVVFLSHKLVTALCVQNEIRAAGAKVLGAEFIPEGEFYPFRTVFSRQNRLQRTVFWGIVAVLGMRTLSYLIDEIAYTVRFVGFTAKDLPITLVYWLILIVIPCLLAYLLALGCIKLSEKKNRS